jgi:hypothetical protein
MKAVGRLFWFLLLGALGAGAAWSLHWLLHAAPEAPRGFESSSRPIMRLVESEIDVEAEPSISELRGRNEGMPSTPSSNSGSVTSAAPGAGRTEPAASRPQNDPPCIPWPDVPAIPGIPDIPAHLPGGFHYIAASDKGLQARAHAGDGYAQQEYATRLQNRLVSELLNLDLGNAADRAAWERQFDAMREMFIAAVRNRSIWSARLLGETLLMHPRRDPVEAAAWLHIEEQMGGSTLRSLERQGVLVLTDEQREASKVLAMEYVETFDLWFLRRSPSPATPSASDAQRDASGDCLTDSR